MKRIFLIGYMGSGKTTIGKLLAARLGFSFVDMDKHIEEKEFKSVSQIFAEKGESEFRLIEQKCLHEVAEFENIVISTGGGAPCFFDNIRFMNTHGTTVYLKLSAAELADRLESSRANKRPLLAERKGEELQQFIAEGLAKREPFYEQAAYSVSGDIDEVVDQICKLI
ncbi:MAG: shikimate kinase [Paludibacter sp.]